MLNRGARGPFDKTLSAFSPEGRLFQVEYALEAVRRGMLAVGIKDKGGAVIVIRKKAASPLMDLDSIEKLFKVDEHIGVAISGLHADSRKLVKNKEIYENNDLFPGELFTNVGVQSFRGFNILILLFHPVQYNPVSGELFYYQDIDVIVETTSDSPNDLFRGLNEDKFEVMNKVDNPSIAEYYFPSNHEEPTFFESYDLMILTTDSLESGFVPLKPLKQFRNLVKFG